MVVRLKIERPRVATKICIRARISYVGNHSSVLNMVTDL